jgi:hypothetical protein
MSDRTMSEIQASESIKSLQVDLSAEVYDALIAKQHLSGCNISELVQQSLYLYLGLEAKDRTKDLAEDLRSPMEQMLEIRLSELESRIMERVYMEIETRLAGIKVETTSSNMPLADTPLQMPPPVRQLQIGDIVQIRDPDSPHYMEQLRITELGIIRATVSTDFGNQTFLKRDLRFVHSESDGIA